MALRIAVFSDVHSNYHAFEACFRDAVRRGAEQFIFLGDYVSDLADPRRTLDLVYEIRSRYDTVCLRGNRERYMLECRAGKSVFSPGSKTGSLFYTYSQLTEEDLDFFASLPDYARISLESIDLELAHAAKGDDRFYFDPWDGNLDAAFSKMEAPILLTGHSHKQYLRQQGGKAILNPGSIGVPRDCGPLTQYATLETGDGSIRFLLHQLPYDYSAMVRRQFESGLTETAKTWAISVLYDVLTGEEYTMELLQRVLKTPEASVQDETLWKTLAKEMGMKFSLQEILALVKNL